MSGWLTRAGGALAVLLVLAYAHAPVLTAGLTDGEFRTLVEVERLVRPPEGLGIFERLGGLWEVHGLEGEPLAALSLAAERLAQRGPVGAGALVGLRAASLLLLLAAALAIGVFLERLLRPWTGSEQARAAGLAAAVLIAVAPLHGAAVASLGARGDLIALLLCGAGGALHLIGRQERRHGLVLAAALAALLAGAASRLALGLPPIVAAAEYASGRRHRPAAARLRTAGTTLLVAGLCVLLPLFAAELAGFSVPSARWGQSLGEALVVGLERLGVLVLPVNQTATGPLGFALCGALLLLALQPALQAARSAPRLWGWMLLGWCAAALAFEAFSVPARVHPGDLTRAPTLLFGSTAAAVGLAVAATAISGLRRVLVPAALAAGWALLAHANGGALNAAARAVEQWQGDLFAARARHGRDARLLAIDVPERVAGLEPWRGALPWMLDPLFDPAAGGAGGAGEPARAVHLSRRGLSALAREAEFEALRREPLIAVYAEGGRRASLRLEPVEPFDLRRSFYREGRFELDAASAGARALIATVKAPSAEPPRLGWRTATGATGELTGAWLAGEDGARAVFDLTSSLEWLLAQHVKSVYSVGGGWSRIEEGVLQDALPAAAASGPEVRGDDWVFQAEDGAEAGGAWSLELLELGELRFEELPAEPLGGGALLVRGAERSAAELLAQGAGPLAWTLIRRVGGTAVACLSGRR